MNDNGARFDFMGALMQPDADSAWVDALLRRPDWHLDALCAEPDYPTRWFFPELGETGTAAKSVCRSCLVRRECLADALARPVASDAGVWGGLSEQERRAARKLGLTADDLLAGEHAALDAVTRRSVGAHTAAPLRVQGFGP